MGSLDADGYLYLSDRQTDMILAGGANIYPAEIEAALDEHPRVRSCAVIGLPDDDLGNVVHAIVQTDDGSPIDLDDLRAHLADRLVRYKIPRTFEFTSDPLRDDAGKLRRSALRADRLEPTGKPGRLDCILDSERSSGPTKNTKTEIHEDQEHEEQETPWEPSNSTSSTPTTTTTRRRTPSSAICRSTARSWCSGRTSTARTG